MRFLSLLFLALPALAQEAPLALRLEVSPQGPVWVGQRVTVTLTALTPTRFASSPDFPELAPESRAIVLPEGTTVPGSERVGGANHVTLQHSYDLFPAQAGTLVLPRIGMSARVGDGAEARAEVDGLRIQVRAPPGATDLSRLVVAPEFQLTATTDRPPEGLRVGEAITRTLRLEARDTASMLLPVALWGRPEGVAVYPDPPELHDETSRGNLRATRQERAAYVPQRPGTVELPGFAFTWFEPRAGRMQTVSVAPIRFEALPAEAVPPSGRPFPWLAAGALALFLAAIGGFIPFMRRSRHAPEREAFAALREACRADRAQAAFASLYRWRDTLARPVSEAATDATPLLKEARRLEDLLYAKAPSSDWRGSALLRAAKAARHRLLHPAVRRPQAQLLPELNPTAPQR
nr:hypothetical protein [uncultured Roseococcus sp.]